MKNKNELMDRRRYLIKIYGIVQGVGFRPFVYKKAKIYRIRGWVENMGGAVTIDCSGEKNDIKHFLLSIIKKPPSLSKIEKVECLPLSNALLSDENITKDSFVINQSVMGKEQIRFISPDIATCPKCLEDIRIKDTNRYRYAFTNCTECGPRYSIIKALPYDRDYTTMKNFYMCEACQKEYDNPLSRRFHAQPNCCEKCGPMLFLLYNNGKEIECQDVIRETIKRLKSGKILAIKGLCGFHLVCNARDEQAIVLLRIRKQRNHKPLAMMIKNTNIIKELCYVSEKEEEVLKSNKRPIVLLKKKPTVLIPEAVAPNQNKLGIMLPYTPLQHLLFDDQLDALIMTSGNISRMPIEYNNDEAVSHLSNLADFFLIHNREIYIPSDDSVVKITHGTETITRRARGYIPYSSKIGTEKQILALGAGQKNTFSVSKNSYVYLSQHLGDLEEMSCYQNFQKTLDHFMKIFDIIPEILVYDYHPSYLSTLYAKSHTGRKIAVQHHHAHMVSCMAEHSIDDTVIGVIFDGTGLGLDGAIWGGEFFIGNRSSFKRVGQLEYVTIQGGNQAVKEPWRCALSYLHALGFNAAETIQGVEVEKLEMVQKALNAGMNCFLSSSIGRLFDAVSSLIGIRNRITYDGQAAIELENIIDTEVEESYSWAIKETDGVFRIQYKDIIEGIVNDVQKNEQVSKISAKFHNSLAEASCALVCTLREKESINKVVLSGGVFENQYLLEKIYKSLTKSGFRVFYNQQIPINDGGLSFGQIHVAIAIMETGGE